MTFKKIAAGVLLCGATHNAMCMDTASKFIGGAVTGAMGLVRSGVIATKEKLDPAQIFDQVHDKWPTKDNREKVTLLHKLDRGFLDGFLQETSGDITKLLDAIEATVPRYPICELTLSIVHEFLGEKLPAIVKRPDLLKRAITARYLLRPDTLAPDIMNQSFTNLVQDKANREAIVGSVVKTLIERENAKEANILVTTLKAKNKVEVVVPFSTHAQITLKAFLAAAAVSSLASCEYIDGLGNTNAEDPINAELKKGSEIVARIKERVQAIQESNAREEQALLAQQTPIAERSKQIAAQKAEQEKASLELARQLQETERQKAEIAKAQAEIARLCAETEEAERQYAAQLEQARMKKEAALQLLAEQQALSEQAQLQDIPAQQAEVPAVQQQAAAPAQQRIAAEAPAAAQKRGGNAQRAPLNTSVDLSSSQQGKQNANSSKKG